jgi:CspA family cold shock protein
MSTGKVKFLNETKGFGFITEDGTNKEIFVHVSNVNGKINKDDAVSFEIEDGKKGINAVNVKRN